MPAGTQNDEYDDDDLDGDDSSLVKDLRKQIKDLTRDNSKLQSQLGQFVTQQRQTTLAEALKAKGLNPSAAKFYPADADVDEEAITAWITENADVFGPVKAATDDTPAPGDPGEGQALQGQQVEIPSFVAPEDLAAFQRMQAASLVGTSATTRDAETLSGIKGAKTPEELTAFLRSQR